MRLASLCLILSTLGVPATAQAKPLTLRQAIERFVRWEANYLEAQSYTIDRCSRSRPEQMSCHVTEFLLFESGEADQGDEGDIEAEMLIESPGITTARLAGKRIEVWNVGTRKKTRRWYRR